jgi:hypothetical protein
MGSPIFAAPGIDIYFVQESTTIASTATGQIPLLELHRSDTL